MDGSAAGSDSRFRLRGFAAAAPVMTVRLPVRARSLAVASFITGRILLTASWKSVKACGKVNCAGLEKGS